MGRTGQKLLTFSQFPILSSIVASLRLPDIYRTMGFPMPFWPMSNSAQWPMRPVSRLFSM